MSNLRTRFAELTFLRKIIFIVLFAVMGLCLVAIQQGFTDIMQHQPRVGS